MGQKKQCEESTLGLPVKPRGGVPSCLVIAPPLPGSSGFFLTIIQKQNLVLFVLFFKKNLYPGLVFIVYMGTL